MQGNNKVKGKWLYNKQEQVLNIYKQWIKINQASLLYITALDYQWNKLYHVERVIFSRSEQFFSQ